MPESLSNPSEGFILTRQWRDAPGGVELTIWLATASGPRELRYSQLRSTFFLPRADWSRAERVIGADRPDEVREVEMTDFAGKPVLALYFLSHRRARRAAERLVEAGLAPLEADINPAERFLMERFIYGALRFSAPEADAPAPIVAPRIAPAQWRPALKVVSLDIETAIDELALFSIGVHGFGNGADDRRVFMVGEGATQDWVESLPSARAVLERFLSWLRDFDPDVIIGWNVVNFDLWYLQRVARQQGVALDLGRRDQPAQWRTIDEETERRTCLIPGRIVLDGVEWLRAAFYRFESFSLQHVATELLGEGKLLHGSDRGEEIGRLFAADKTRLADYNLRDCELVSEIFTQTRLLDFAVSRSLMTGLNPDRLGASVASFDNLYLPRLHRAGHVAPTAAAEPAGSPGGFVLDSRPGIYRNVLVLDFKSLYPSIIRTFRIDPLGLALGTRPETPETGTVPGFRGARFAREGHLLPDLIASLWQLRDAARSSGDAPLSQAIKILMNSFYGVLGTPGCRFFDPRLASSITLRGQEILKRTRDEIERLGHAVIYGDTDSVFVWVGDERSADEAARVGQSLQDALNGFWRREIADNWGVTSYLELEFETLFTRFLMPTVRGSDKGSKKRYAGMTGSGEQERLIFKGLENVRSDWTALARHSQETLLDHVFHDRPYENFLRQTVADLFAGKLDAELVYRKRLRRRLSDYARTSPPHVQAARLLQARSGRAPRRGDWIRYVVTVAGPEPADDARAPLDYGHYLERQLRPVVDGILNLLGESLADTAEQQIGLF